MNNIHVILICKLIYTLDIMMIGDGLSANTFESHFFASILDPAVFLWA